MNQYTEVEKASAEKEARDAVARRTSGSGTASREAALSRFLGAEQYHEVKVEERDKEA